MKKILILTGDGGESFETLFAYHRFLEAGYDPVIASTREGRIVTGQPWQSHPEFYRAVFACLQAESAEVSG